MGRFFFENWHICIGTCDFQIPSGTSLPKPNLSLGKWTILVLLLGANNLNFKNFESTFYTESNLGMSMMSKAYSLPLNMQKLMVHDFAHQINVRLVNKQM